MAATTAMCSSFKAELPQALHCFAAPQTKTGTVVSAAFTVTALANVTGLIVGMAASGTNIAAGAVIASIDSSTQVTLSKPHTGSSSPSITFTADTFKIALIKNSMAGTYGAASTNYTDITGNSDEASGTGYTATGQALATNVTPALTSTTAFWSWSANPSWSGASFSAAACMIYNTTNRGGQAGAGRAVSVHDFGGTQTVSSGTFTVVLPTNDSSNAILRIT